MPHRAKVNRSNFTESEKNAFISHAMLFEQQNHKSALLGGKQTAPRATALHQKQRTSEATDKTLQDAREDPRTRSEVPVT